MWGIWKHTFYVVLAQFNRYVSYHLSGWTHPLILCSPYLGDLIVTKTYCLSRGIAYLHDKLIYDLKTCVFVVPIFIPLNSRLVGALWPLGLGVSPHGLHPAATRCGHDSSHRHSGQVQRSGCSRHLRTRVSLTALVQVRWFFFSRVTRVVLVALLNGSNNCIFHLYRSKSVNEKIVLVTSLGIEGRLVKIPWICSQCVRVWFFKNPVDGAQGCRPSEPSQLFWSNLTLGLPALNRFHERHCNLLVERVMRDKSETLLRYQLRFLHALAGCLLSLTKPLGA